MVDVKREKNVYYDILFHGFEGKESEIKGVSRLDSLVNEKRWYFKKIGKLPFEPMFYRTNLSDHSEMVSWIGLELLPYAIKAYPGYFDLEMQRKTLTLSLVHDDVEILDGDESSAAKDKFTEKQVKIKKVEELDSINKLAEQYPNTVNGFNYRELLLATLYKNTLEAQFVSVCDKIVGLGESLHEIYAGNEEFIIDPNDEDNIPARRYIERWLWKKENAKKGNKLPWNKMGPLFRRNHIFLNKPGRLTTDDLFAIANDPDSKPHTEKSILLPTKNKFYNKYKEVILEQGGQRGLELLVEQREFIP